VYSALYVMHCIVACYITVPKLMYVKGWYNSDSTAIPQRYDHSTTYVATGTAALWPN